MARKKTKAICPTYTPRGMAGRTSIAKEKKVRDLIVLRMYKKNTNKTYSKLKKLLEGKNIFICTNTIFNIIKRNLLKDKK